MPRTADAETHALFHRCIRHIAVTGGPSSAFSGVDGLVGWLPLRLIRRDPIVFLECVRMLRPSTHQPPVPAPLRVLIVDDEELGRELLRTRLRAVPGIEVLGESSNGFDALRAIRELRPDVVFMDIEIPGLDGLRVVEQIAEAQLPLVIFVTGHSAYAPRAFELNAIDYVLKPFTTHRLVEAVERARARLAHGETDHNGSMVAVMEAPQRADIEESDDANALTVGGRARRLIVRDRSGYVLVQLSEVESLEAAGNYVRIVCGRRVFLMRSTMGDLEAVLDAEQFARVHRSTIVNIDAIQRITPHASGDFEILLNSGRSVRMSRSYRRRLLP